MSDLPVRSPEQLAIDLRARADYKTGSEFEFRADTAMMREAADALDAQAQEITTLRAEREQLREAARAALTRWAEAMPHRHDRAAFVQAMQNLRHALASAPDEESTS